MASSSASVAAASSRPTVTDWISTPASNTSTNQSVIKPWVIAVIAVVGLFWVFVFIIFLWCWRRRRDQTATTGLPGNNDLAHWWHSRKGKWGSTFKETHGVGESGDELRPNPVRGSTRDSVLTPFQSSNSLVPPPRQIGTLPSSKELRERRWDSPLRRSFDAVSMSEFSGPITTAPSTSVWPERTEGGTMESGDPSPRYRAGVYGRDLPPIPTAQFPPQFRQGNQYYATPSGSTNSRRSLLNNESPRIWTNGAQGWWDNKDDKEETPEVANSPARTAQSPPQVRQGTLHPATPTRPTDSGVGPLNNAPPRIWTSEAQGWWENKEDREEVLDETDSAYVTPSPVESETPMAQQELEALSALVSRRLAKIPGTPTGDSTGAPPSTDTRR